MENALEAKCWILILAAVVATLGGIYWVLSGNWYEATVWYLTATTCLWLHSITKSVLAIINLNRKSS